MNFKVFIVGSKIEKFYADAVSEYKKRLSRYCKIQVTHVKKLDKLSRKLSDKMHIIMISPLGQQISSEELADKINYLGMSGTPDVAIIIGCDTINNVAEGENCDIGVLPHNEVLAVSPMVMDHGLTAVIVFEQIYRAFKIINREPYHK